MNTSRQILLDKLVARPIAVLLNYLTQVVGKILQLDHNLNRPLKTIAVCKFKGIGSIIQATPMLTALKELHPNANIIFVSTHGNRKLLEKIDMIDEIITVKDTGIFSLTISSILGLNKLIRKRCDVYIDLEIYSDFSTIFTLLAISKNRVGYYLRSSSYRMGIYTHMMFFNSGLPISEVYMQMARLLGNRDEKPAIFRLKSEINKVPAFISEPYILINPNASDLRIERRWPEKNFIELITRLLDQFPGFNYYIIGSKSEKAYSQSIINQINSERVVNIAGETTLDQLIYVIENTSLLITNDTGPMHIGFSCRTPTICLFGPCSPAQYGSHPSAFVIYKKVYCSPCVHDFTIPPCMGDNICMQRIKVQDVILLTTKILAGEEPATVHPEETIYQDMQKPLGIVYRKGLPRSRGSV